MSDLKSIKKVITTLMSQSELSPAGDPFQYLWIANCVLYSVIVAFLLLKGWKKNTPGHSNNSRKPTPKWKIVYEKKVMETRKKISIAKAEMERIKENRKLSKRGRKNRAFLEKECTKISVPELVSYMDKNKMLLRKLKRGFCKKKVMEESRVLNRQFQEDPGRVYDGFNCMSKNIGNQTSGLAPTQVRKTNKGLKTLTRQVDTGKSCGRQRGLVTNQRYGYRKSREQYMGVSVPQMRGNGA